MTRRNSTVPATILLATLVALPGWAGERLREPVDPRLTALDRASARVSLAALDAAFTPVEASRRAAWPGPDGYFYTGFDCAYHWVDVSTTGTAIPELLADDDCPAAPIPIGFSFPFYGDSYVNLFPNSNGWLYLTNGTDKPTFCTGAAARTNQCSLPDAGAPNTIVALLWDDLDGRTATPAPAAHYQSFAAGTCPWPGHDGACLVLQYDHWKHYAGAADSAGTWEGILLDDGRVVVQVLDSGAERGAGSTTGIEGDNAAAGYGLTYACDTADSVGDTLCLGMQRVFAPMLSQSTKTAPGFAAPGDEVTYVVTLRNTGNQDSTATTLSDPLPAGATYAGNLSCSAPTCFYDDPSDTVGWVGPVGQGESVTVSFDATLDATCPTVVTNTATVDDPATAAPVEVSASTALWDVTAFSADLESDNGGFVVASGEWEWGVPTYPTDLAAHSGTQVWATNLSGPVQDDAMTHILSRMLSLPFVTEGSPLELSWWDWNGPEAADTIRVTVNGTTVYTANDLDQRFWVRHSVDLSPWSGQTVELQLRLECCCANPGPDGWVVDDVAVTYCEPPTGLYLTPEALTGSGCSGVPAVKHLVLYNNTELDGDFALAYQVQSGNGELTGPSSIHASEGESVPFDVTLTPDQCIPGETVSATVSASGNGFEDTTALTTQVDSNGVLWDAMVELPAPGRYDHAVVAVADSVYVLGGDDGAGSLNGEVFRYDPGGDSWTAGPTMPTPMAVVDGGAIGTSVYIPGGLVDGGSTSSTVQVLDTVGGSWGEAESAPRSVAGYGVATCGGLLYRVGGSDVANWPNGQNGAEVYDPVADSWSALDPMATGRTWPAVECVDGVVYAAGGVDEDGATTSEVEAYSVATASWSTRTPMPAPRWGAADFVRDGKLFVAGGSEAAGGVATTVVYDPVADSWSGGEPLADVRWRVEGAAANGSGYVVGGMDPQWEPHSTNEYLEFCPTCPADLQLTNTDERCSLLPGQTATYTITVRNLGPSLVDGATVEDLFPAELTGVTWSCSGSGGGTCTANGSGDISDLVTLPAGGEVVYLASATLVQGASGILLNTASVTPPVGTTDPSSANNSATDVDAVETPLFCDDFERGDASAWSQAVP